MAYLAYRQGQGDGDDQARNVAGGNHVGNQQRTTRREVAICPERAPELSWLNRLDAT
jgi:hypothetical protein